METVPAIPPLPVELWRLIIRLVTYTPNFLDCSLRSPFDDGRTEDPEIARQIYNARTCKAPVSLVCKTWRSISLGHLFEDITYTITEETYRISNGGNPKSFPPECSPFHFVRRIRATFPEEMSRKELYRPFKRVLKQCSNLTVLHLVGRPEHDPLIPSCLRACRGHSIRRLQIEGLIIPAQLPQLLSASLPDLEHLSIADCRFPEGASIAPTPLNLPRLHTLRLSEVDLRVSSYALPNLELLCVDFVALEFDDIPDTLPKNVPMISVCRWHGFSLQDLVTSHTEIFAFPAPLAASLQSGPSIKRICLRPPRIWWAAGHQPVWNDANHQDLMSILDKLVDRSQFPALTHIRCQKFKPKLLVKAGHQVWYKAWKKKVKACGIQVDDSRDERTTAITDNFGPNEYLL